jgi:hypothetical protein
MSIINFYFYCFCKPEKKKKITETVIQTYIFADGEQSRILQLKMIIFFSIYYWSKLKIGFPIIEETLEKVISEMLGH